jgi:hypothetical protein
MELLLLVGFVVGYLVSWIQWYQPERKKAQALARGFAQVSARMLDLELAQTKVSQQDYPRAQGWKSYQNSLQEQESDLARESARQQEEKQQWKQW